MSWPLSQDYNEATLLLHMSAARAILARKNSPVAV
jgi:hypothetical protein